MNYKCLLLIAMPLLWASCEEVIRLDLKDADPRTVIEGSLNATKGECTVTATKSFGFYESGEFSKIEGATVELVDGSNTVTRLQEVSPGNYWVNNLKMKVGDLVRLNFIVSTEEQYSAETRVPRPVPLESLAFDKTIADPRIPDNPSIYVINAKWTDPGCSFNYYRFKTINNGIDNNGSFAITFNEHYCGTTVKMPLFYDLFALGDTVNLEFQSIDSASYFYYDQINDMQLPSFVSATPYNPVGNFNNRALGIFGIYQTEALDVIVPMGK